MSGERDQVAAGAEGENSASEEAGFEAELDALENAVDELERGELTLEQAIERFERGFRSMKRCYALLRDAQKRIEVLCAGDDGETQWKPFPIKDLNGADAASEEGSAPAV